MSETTRERFDRQVRELGGEPAYDEWLGVLTPHRVICSSGHECNPWPTNVNKGCGLCMRCANAAKTIKANSEARFLKRLKELGGERGYDEWQGTHYKHRVICSNGHELFPRPHDVLAGHGICQSCNVSARMKPVQAACEAKFAAKVRELGGTPSWDEWAGVQSKHKIICKDGHTWYPVPNSVLSSGNGICSVCSGQDSFTAEQKFRNKVHELGGECKYEFWQGSQTKHYVVCKEGHECFVRPTHVANMGYGICRKCSGRFWDIFYVVYSPSAHEVKFGITSTSPQLRISTHRYAGFTEQLYLRENFEGSHALEAAVKHGLALSGFKPVRGQEYFREDALPFIMSMLPDLGLASSLCTVVMPRSLGVGPIGFGGWVNDRRVCCRRVPFGIS